MKMRHFIFLTASLIFLFAFSEMKIASGKLFNIPAQQFDYSKELGRESKAYIVAVDSFQISSFVTFGEYKTYLDQIKKDSSLAFYQSQLPDSDMCAHDAYVKYVNSSDYDNYAVSGISWDNAMNFCKWKTIRENQKDSFNIIYRLPTIPEWLSAYRYLKEQQIANDFNQDYSDWTLTTVGEFDYAFFDLGETGYGNYIYWALPNESKDMKRKIVMGNSFHFSEPKFDNFMHLPFYEMNGYSYIGFRYLKEHLKPLEKMNDRGTYSWDMDHEILNHWKLIKQPKFKVNRYK
jgi:hypothetical protein